MDRHELTTENGTHLALTTSDATTNLLVSVCQDGQNLIIFTELSLDQARDLADFLELALRRINAMRVKVPES